MYFIKVYKRFLKKLNFYKIGKAFKLIEEALYPTYITSYNKVKTL